MQRHIKITNRYTPDHIAPDASQPIAENAYTITRDSRATQEYIQTYTESFKIQCGAVEFKTLEDLENDYEE
jgi:predicted nucleic acid-binding protein